ncbi:MAG: permease [Pontiellaceae bacterium]|nr:permease [Pontiellaceae bacterium]MBN2783534.1 permease [Pontiellaceae bacterium]
MKKLYDIAWEIWTVTIEMAPFLLFGFLMAGILSVLISKDYVRRHLGDKGWMGSFKAALVGVPMPICSCGVIPLAASLRKHGASRGATASFLASTPQTGIDSLMITYALLGWVFAVFRAAVAFISGIACGTAVAAVSPAETESTETCEDECCQPDCEPALRRMLKYGFIILPRNIAKAVVVGIILSGIISGLIPDDFITDNLGDSSFAMLLMLIIGIPIYVCSSASVPIALAFIKAGISPGAALVFLITGPATNAATLTTLWQIIGRKQLAVFLITLASCALIAGWMMNHFSPTLGVMDQICHRKEPAGPTKIAMAVILCLVLINAMCPKKKS